MANRDAPRQAHLEFSDYVNAPQLDAPPKSDKDDCSERQSPAIRKALADGLRQARRGDFADPAAIKAIFRRAGV